MRRLIVIGVIASVAVVPATASAAGKNGSRFAERDCKQERLEEPREFERVFGNGNRAIKRCGRQEAREARRDCREEKREEPREYRRVYGDGSKGLDRCVRDELR